MPVEYYFAFGLTIASEVACPELPPAQGTLEPDVQIRLGPVTPLPGATDPPAARLDVTDGTFTLELPSVARYRVRGGNEIQVDRDPGGDPRDLRSFLLGTVFGALIHQRGLLQLHASAIGVGGAAILFCGESGAGKSTLSAALARRGHTILSDDTGVVVPDDADRPRFHPGVPRLRLWRDALDHLQIGTEGLQRDLSRADKFHLPPFAVASRQPLPLRAIYLLARHEDDVVAIEPVHRHEKIPLLMANTYRPDLARRLGRSAGQFHLCGWLARSVRLDRLSRPWSLARMDQVLERIERDLLRPAA